MATIEKELASAKALHLLLVEVAIPSEADAIEARTDSQDAQARLTKVG